MEKKRLLWVDDDEEGRFSFEKLLLERKGWEGHWVKDIFGALEKLGTEEFDAVILDQALPFKYSNDPLKAHRESVWGGCVVLHWLRRQPLPPQAEGAARAKDLKRFQPKGDNSLVQVMIVSGFHDEELEKVTRSISPQDEEIQISPKPLDSQDLLAFIGKMS